MRELAVWSTPLLILALVLGAVGCGGEDAKPADMTAEELREHVLASADDQKTYRFEIDGKASYRSALEDQVQSDLVRAGTIDILNQEMQADIITVMADGQPEEMRIAVEVYIVEDKVYMGITEGSGQRKEWLKGDSSQAVWELMEWQSQHVDLRRDADITILRVESVDGVPCYVAEISPSRTSLRDKVESQLIGQFGGEELNIESIDNFKWVVWYGRDTYFPMKAKQEYDFTASLRGDEVAGHHNWNMVFDEYNRPVSIQLPPEAEGAEYVGPLLPSPSPTPSPIAGQLETDINTVDTAVGQYILGHGKPPTADGRFPPEGEYALIDFGASFELNGKTWTFSPDFLKKLPKHHDEGVWRIDSKSRVSVDMQPEAGYTPRPTPTAGPTPAPALSWVTDQDTIRVAAAHYYADIHYPGGVTVDAAGTVIPIAHCWPTYSGAKNDDTWSLIDIDGDGSVEVLTQIVDGMDWALLDTDASGVLERDELVATAIIAMPLLENTTDSIARGYLAIPESATDSNCVTIDTDLSVAGVQGAYASTSLGGTHTWFVGDVGRVYSFYRAGNTIQVEEMQSDFSGTYP